MSLVSTGNLRTMCVCVCGGGEGQCGIMWDIVGYLGTLWGQCGTMWDRRLNTRYVSLFVVYLFIQRSGYLVSIDECLCCLDRLFSRCSK